MLVWFAAYGFIPVIIFGILSDKFQQMTGKSAAILTRWLSSKHSSTAEMSGTSSGGLNDTIKSQATTVVA